jgi:hypothetical protein
MPVDRVEIQLHVRVKLLDRRHISETAGSAGPGDAGTSTVLDGTVLLALQAEWGTS